MRDGPSVASAGRREVDVAEVAALHGSTASSGLPSSLELLTAALDRALDEREFTLAFQPKVSLTTSRIVGFEALIRWVLPNGETIAPVDFVPIAETSGHIVTIGDWVLEEACRQLATWQRGYPAMGLTMAVNVSSGQFDPRLVSAVRSALDRTGVAPSDVWLEVTETTVMDNVEASFVILDRLRALGVNISLDDFGTGHSTLAYLRRMPVDELKIDKSFVHGLGVDAVDTAIVASVLSLAQAMGCHVTAEGVESASQLERLRNLGCDSVQGHLLAGPLSPVDIEGYLSADEAGQRWPRRSAASAGAPSVDNQSVLIVDGTGDITMAAMALSAAGFVTHRATSAADAIESACRIKPDHVVLDIGLPDMSATDVCRALRADPSLRRCTIMIVSSVADSTTKAEAFWFGADDYVVKPFAPRDLVARLNAAARRRREMSFESSGVDATLSEMVSSARQSASNRGDFAPTEGNFSERQLEIIERLIRGERVPTIARALYVSQSTVRNHLSAVFRKLGVHSQEELLGSLRKLA